MKKGRPGEEGATGPTGPTETKLPPGQSVKGLWQFQTEGSGVAYVSFSFPLRDRRTNSRMALDWGGSTSERRMSGQRGRTGSGARECLYVRTAHFQCRLLPERTRRVRFLVRMAW